MNSKVIEVHIYQKNTGYGIDQDELKKTGTIKDMIFVMRIINVSMYHLSKPNLIIVLHIYNKAC